MSQVLFPSKRPVEHTYVPTLAVQLELQGLVRFKTMSTGIRLTYDDNPADIVTVWVAEKKRTAIVEPHTKYKPTFGAILSPVST